MRTTASGQRARVGERTGERLGERMTSTRGVGDERRRFIWASSATAWLRFFYGGENYREMLKAVLCGDGPCGGSLHESANGPDDWECAEWARRKTAQTKERLKFYLFIIRDRYDFFLYLGHFLHLNYRLYDTIVGSGTISYGVESNRLYY